MRNVHIDFAHRTFIWDSEANEKAHVHCVIIGFSETDVPHKFIYEDTEKREVSRINPYLFDSPDVIITGTNTPICPVKRLTAGNKPSDGGNLILSEDEARQIIETDPETQLYIRRYVGSRDFINKDENRYCLWLRDVNTKIYRNNKAVMRRLEAVGKMRRESTAKPTRQAAETPYLFFSAPQKKDVKYLAIPEVSSQRRRYIPMGFLPEGWIASNKLLIVENADRYDFGVLTSNVHMAWVRCVTGRLKSDYQYSGAIDYNTFPWPTPTEEQKNRITQTAQGILNARALYPDSSLADLYDPLTMPPELRKAHTANDVAVMKAYGFSTKMSESDCVGRLMCMYQKLMEAK